MMQTGMVKQSLNTYRACLDGTETKNKYYVLPYLTHSIVCLHQLTMLWAKDNGLQYNANTRLNDTRS